MTNQSVDTAPANGSCFQVMATKISTGRLRVENAQDFEVRYVKAAHPEAENLPKELYRTLFPATVLLGVNGDYINEVHENLVVDLQSGSQFQARLARLLVNELAFEEATISYTCEIPLDEKRWLNENANSLGHLADTFAPIRKPHERLQPLCQMFRMLTLHDGSLTEDLGSPNRNAILRRMVDQWWGPDGDVAQRRAGPHG